MRHFWISLTLWNINPNLQARFAQEITFGLLHRVNFRGQFGTLRRADIGFVVTADFIFWAKSSRSKSNGVLYICTEFAAQFYCKNDDDNCSVSTNWFWTKPTETKKWKKKHSIASLIYFGQGLRSVTRLAIFK